MQTLLKKSRTMITGIREYGLFTFFRRLLLESDTDFVGRIVELMGNRVRMDGMMFSVDTAVIPRSNKSQLLQGRFEKEERQAVKDFIDTSLPVIELGGSIGAVACTTNRLLDDPTQHIVVEAHPEMARFLRVNKAQNNCQFEIIEKAIAYNTDTISFFEEGFSSRVEANTQNGIEIATITLQKVIDAAGFNNISLICDIEGAENDLLKYESQILQTFVSLIVIELHPTIVGNDIFEWSLEQFHKLGFEQIKNESDVYVFRNTAH